MTLIITILCSGIFILRKYLYSCYKQKYSSANIYIHFH
jgi:hypothetical protein